MQWDLNPGLVPTLRMLDSSAFASHASRRTLGAQSVSEDGQKPFCGELA